MRDYTKYTTFAQDADKEHKVRNLNYRKKGQGEGYLLGKFHNAEIGAIDEEIKRLGLEINNLMTHMGVTPDENDNNQFSNMIPTGHIITMACNVLPDGYLPCEGADISRTTYANLFTVIGEMYGSGDGSTTFQIPDFRGMFLRGHDNRAGEHQTTNYGVKQEDAGRKVEGEFVAYPSTNGESIIESADGAFEKTTNTRLIRDTWIFSSGNKPTQIIKLDSERNWGAEHTADEFRPINYAVHYCIKY